MRKINFAVSIGSNMTSIYKAGVGVVLHDRSVIVTGLKGKHEVAVSVGEDAFTSGMEYRKVVENGSIDFSLAELMLGEYFRKVEITKRDGVLFLVSLDDMQLASEFKNLAYALGVNYVQVIPHIVATAYGFEIEKFRKSFLIVDIGVTTEVAIINNGRILSGATIYNGGGNIDKKIARYIYEEKGIELSRESAERVKNEIASLYPNDIRSIEVDGFIKDTTEYSSVTISSQDIFGLVIEEYSNIASAILQILSTIDSEVNQDIKRHGIYLCGASSKIAGLEKFLKVKLNLNSYIYKPDAITMIGAGQILDDRDNITKIVLENQ